MTDPIAAERCPTCDRRLATPAEVAAGEVCEAEAGPCLCPRDCCWLLMGGCSGERVDWRARALAAEDCAQFKTFAAELQLRIDKSGVTASDLEAASTKLRAAFRSVDDYIAWVAAPKPVAQQQGRIQMSDPIAAKRCPTCDRRRVSLAEIDTALDCDHGLACVCPRDHCWSPLTGECVGRLRMHWRDRALAAEAERDEWARHYSATTEAAGVALASERDAWKARAEAAEADRRLEPSRTTVAAAERRKVDDDLRALALRATPGPWRLLDGGTPHKGSVSVEEHGSMIETIGTFYCGAVDGHGAANAAFVAAAHPAAVLALLDRVEAAEAEVRRLNSKESPSE